MYESLRVLRDYKREELVLSGLISPGVKKGMLGSREGKIKTKMQFFSFLVHGGGARLCLGVAP